jgi:hypothetical protein
MSGRKIALSCEITKFKAALFIAFLLVLVMPFWLGSESQVVSSYYVSPEGTYNRLFGGTFKGGAANNYLEAGRGNRNIGGNQLNNVDYFYSNTQLYVRSVSGTLNLSPASQIVTFLTDKPTYAPYVANFCKWYKNCPVGHFPMAKGFAKGQIRYGIKIPSWKLCCRMTIQ